MTNRVTSLPSQYARGRSWVTWSRDSQTRRSAGAFTSRSLRSSSICAPSTRCLGCATGQRRPKRCGTPLKASKGATKPSAQDRTLSFLSPIHLRSAWKVNCKKLRFCVLSAASLAYGFVTLPTAILKAAPLGIGAPSLDFLRLLVFGWRPNEQQVLWTIRGAIVLSVPVVISYALGIALWNRMQYLIIPAVLAAGGVLVQSCTNHATAADRRPTRAELRCAGVSRRHERLAARKKASVS